MKELSIEEKARRYDEVVNKLKGFMAQDVDPLITRNDVQDFFPELKESEDEVIRKHLIKHFGNKSKEDWNGVPVKSILAWLEKQGGHAKFINGIQVGGKVTRNEDGVLFNLSQLNRVAKKDEKQDKKHIDRELSNLLNRVICRFINDPNIPYSERDEVSKKIIPYVEQLEKQGKQKHAELTNSQFVEKCKGLSDLEKYILSLVPTRPIDAIKVDARTIRHLVEQEQKSADKDEPKFKVGDWIVFNGLTLLVNEVVQGYYRTISIGGIRNSYDWNIDSAARLWTIKDAKDGDVLAFNDGHGNHSIELIKSITDKKIEFWFCLINGNRYEVFDGIVPYTNLISREDATPATKEQRDLLFQKMKEAGYEWDADKKELRKIEQKPLWGEEDERLIEEAAECLRKYASKVQGGNSKVYVLSLADRIESLRPQNTWKPSDEQMKALQTAIGIVGELTPTASLLKEIREQLKKLMEN